MLFPLEIRRVDIGRGGSAGGATVTSPFPGKARAKDSSIPPSSCTVCDSLFLKTLAGCPLVSQRGDTSLIGANRVFPPSYRADWLLNGQQPIWQRTALQLQYD